MPSEVDVKASHGSADKISNLEEGLESPMFQQLDLAKTKSKVFNFK
jgi:hypothetical protein